MDKVIIDKLNEFVDKIKSKEWEIEPRANQIILADGKAILAVWLAKTMSDFELAEEPKPIVDRVTADILAGPNWRSLEDYKKREYERVIEKFNEMVNQAYIHGVVTDNKLKKELKNCHDEKSKLEKLADISKDMIKQLTTDKTRLQKTIDRHYERYPILEDIDKKENNVVEDSEVTRG